VLHTNLGRAPLSASASDAMVTAAAYVDVEFDVETGARARRGRGTLAALRDAVPAAGELLRGPAGRAMLQYLTARGHRPHAELRVAELGPEAGIVGAGDLARDR